MADEKPVYLTEQGRQELVAELEHLRLVKRPEVAARISQAKEYGDISENSEYEDAKNEQAFTEGRIRTIESVLNRARLIKDDTRGAPGSVRLGTRVTTVDDTDERETWTLVSSAEANAAQGKISDESLVGRALLGKKVGDQVTVQAPKGSIKFKVVAIE
jgi:transcription elongation factor GreA